MTLTGRVGNEPLQIEARVFDDGKAVSSASGQAGFELWPALRENKVAFYKTTGSWFTTDLTVPLKHAKLWSPDHPFLYDLVVTLKDKNGQVVDTVKSFSECGSSASKPTQRFHSAVAQRPSDHPGRRAGSRLLAGWHLHCRDG